MNLIITSLASILFFLLPQSSIYEIQLNTIDGNTVSMQTYQNKKIIVTEFDAANPDGDELQYLDSLQATNTSVVVIAVPATDFTGTTTQQDLISLRNSLNLHMIITLPSEVKKTDSTSQSSLFKWLTNVDQNEHFDEDVDEPGKIFIVSGNGILYSQLRKETPHEIIETSLNNPINE